MELKDCEAQMKTMKKNQKNEHQILEVTGLIFDYLFVKGSKKGVNSIFFLLVKIYFMIQLQFPHKAGLATSAPNNSDEA